MRKVFSLQEIKEKKIPTRGDFQNVLRKIRKALKEHHRIYMVMKKEPLICGAYIFGSGADGSYDCRSDLDILLFIPKNADVLSFCYDLCQYGLSRNVKVEFNTILCDNGVADCKQQYQSFTEMVMELVKGPAIIPFLGSFSCACGGKENEQKNYLYEVEDLLNDPVYHEAIYLSLLSNVHLHFARKMLHWKGIAVPSDKVKLCSVFVATFPKYAEFFNPCVRENKIYDEWLKKPLPDSYKFMKTRLILGQHSNLREWVKKYSEEIWPTKDAVDVIPKRITMRAEQPSPYQSYAMQYAMKLNYGKKSSY